MKIRVVTDGSVDVPADLAEQYDIPIVPPIVMIDGEQFLSGVDIQPTEFLQRQRTARELPKTSQPTPGQFAEVFEESLGRYDHIFYVAISSALSGTMNSAQQAATQFPADRITVHDSRTASAAAGMQVIAAARAIEQGGGVTEALEAARRMHEATDLFITVGDLTYLIKGGRIGKVAGAVGSFLNIKPVIQMDKEQGVLVPITRVRSFKAATKKLVEQAEETIGAGGAGRFVVLYADTEDEANWVEAQLNQRFDVRWLRRMVPPPTLLAHFGPQALGLVVTRGDW